MPFYKLIDALGNGRLCPLCFVERRNVKSYFESLLYEFVNDRDVQMGIRDSGGFCREHSGTLLSFGDSQGTAILYDALLRDEIERVSAALSSRKPALPERVPRCPACAQGRAAVRRDVHEILSGIDDPELSSALRESPPFCDGHFALVFNAVRSREHRQKVAEIQKAKLERAHAELSSFLAKQEFKGSVEDEKGIEFSDGEKSSWKRAVIRQSGLDPD